MRAGDHIVLRGSGREVVVERVRRVWWRRGNPLIYYTFMLDGRTVRGFAPQSAVQAVAPARQPQETAK